MLNVVLQYGSCCGDPTPERALCHQLFALATSFDLKNIICYGSCYTMLQHGLCYSSL